MGSEWPDVPLETLAADEKGAIAIGPFGSRMKADVYVSAGIPVIRGMNITGTRWLKDDWVYVSQEFADGIRNCVVQPGDLVFPHRGAIGEVALIEPQHGKMVLSTSMMKFRPDQGKANPLFLYYYFRSARGRQEILRYSSQVGTPGVGQPLTSMRKFLVPNPPLPTQNVIADILGSLDDKIELNRQINRTLEAMARAIFKAWFVDFEPVKAKASGATSFRGMPQAVFDQLPNHFTDTELGLVPEGWELGTLSHVADLNPESWSRSMAPGTVRYVDLANTKWGLITSITEYPWESAPSRARRILRPWDTIVGTVRPGNGSYVLIMERGLTGSTGFAVLRPREPRNGAFVYCAATSRDNIDRLSHLADGAAYPAVRPDIVAETPIVTPPDPILEEFARLVDPLLARVAAAETESRTLAAIRDTLLPKLISGELRVSVAEGGADGG